MSFWHGWAQLESYVVHCSLRALTTELQRPGSVVAPNAHSQVASSHRASSSGCHNMLRNATKHKKLNFSKSSCPPCFRGSLGSPQEAVVKESLAICTHGVFGSAGLSRCCFSCVLDAKTPKFIFTCINLSKKCS